MLIVCCVATLKTHLPQIFRTIYLEYKSCSCEWPHSRKNVSLPGGFGFYDCANAKCITISIAQNISHATAVEMQQIGIYLYEGKKELDDASLVLDSSLSCPVPGPILA